ncbi:MAG: glycoside hydrolase family 65 protein [Bacteroidia bacterium]|nr:glycoside hydrolase family 65 protein [Bacteroidia bacterium]
MTRTITTFLIIFFFGIFLFAQDKADPWIVTAKNYEESPYFGITVANGMIGLVSAPEPMQSSAVVLNGIYDNYQRGRVSNILQVFDPVSLEMEIDGELVTRTKMKEYSQSLDMKKAELITQFSFQGKVEVSHELMALRQLPHTALALVNIKANKDIKIKSRSLIKSPDHLREVRNYFATIDRPHVSLPLMTSVGQSPTGVHKVAASNSFIFEEKHGSEPEVIHVDWDFNRHWMEFEKEIKAGESYTFAVVSSIISSEHNADPFNEAERLTLYARLEGIERLLKRHEAAWDKLWESDILIEGDPMVQQEVHSAIYHLYSFAREGTSYSLSPMGLSGLGYNGHIFWDTEIWMYPPLLLLQPEIAKSLLDYRFERMEAARQNAFSHGYKGVMFPWESADDGGEETPIWALTGPFQHHITGDVAWAFWKYYQVTKDKEWLRERGYPMLKEVADFWTSRVERQGPGAYHIRNVIGANEYQENIDDNAYTNGMAITVLGYASQAAKVLGLEPDPDWAHVAQNIPILKFDNGTTRENATYNGEMIKQADVNLLAYPLDIVRDKKQLRKDLLYYEEKMDPQGPAMGFSVIATLYARINKPEKAYEVFVNSYRPNAVPPLGVLSETAGGTNPYFATGAGGLLQTVLNGFGGLEITDQGVEQIGGALPKSWEKLTLKGIGMEEKTFEVK